MRVNKVRWLAGLEVYKSRATRNESRTLVCENKSCGHGRSDMVFHSDTTYFVHLLKLHDLPCLRCPYLDEAWKSLQAALRKIALGPENEETNTAAKVLRANYHKEIALHFHEQTLFRKKHKQSRNITNGCLVLLKSFMNF